MNRRNVVFTLMGVAFVGGTLAAGLHTLGAKQSVKNTPALSYTNDMQDGISGVDLKDDRNLIGIAHYFLCRKGD